MTDDLDNLRCPSCGGSDLGQTLIGVISGPDPNTASCNDCEWHGPIGLARHSPADFRSPPHINGSPVPTKKPEAPISEEEFYRELGEAKKHFIRLLVKALAVIPHDDLAIFSADQPGIFLDAFHEGKSGPARIVLSVPEELVRNFKGATDQRDLLLLIHLPRETQKFLEGVGGDRIYLPSG